MQSGGASRERCPFIGCFRLGTGTLVVARDSYLPANGCPQGAVVGTPALRRSTAGSSDVQDEHAECVEGQAVHPVDATAQAIKGVLNHTSGSPSCLF